MVTIPYILSISVSIKASRHVWLDNKCDTKEIKSILSTWCVLVFKSLTHSISYSYRCFIEYKLHKLTDQTRTLAT